MIEYDTGRWGLRLLWTLHGSVFPKALAFAIPASVICAFVNVVMAESWREDVQDLSEASYVVTLLGSYNAVIAFILVFRSNMAFSRWWEGGTLIQQMRGEWFNAYSSLLAFCTTRPEKRQDVYDFQQLLIRLMSLLYGLALQEVSTMAEKDFEIFDLEGLDLTHTSYLQSCSDRCSTAIQWIQRLVILKYRDGTVEVEGAVLSRVFQELSRGVVQLNNARKITEFPFPFPWTQMITVLLIVQFIFTPIMAGLRLESPMIASLVTFLVIFSSWGVHYISQELENPFGDDQNDLPLRAMQADMNRSLLTLMHPHAQSPPSFDIAQRTVAGQTQHLKSTSTKVITDGAVPTGQVPLTASIVTSSTPSEGRKLMRPGRRYAKEYVSEPLCIVSPDSSTKLDSVNSLHRFQTPVLTPQCTVAHNDDHAFGFSSLQCHGPRFFSGESAHGSQHDLSLPSIASEKDISDPVCVSQRGISSTSSASRGGSLTPVVESNGMEHEELSSLPPTSPVLLQTAKSQRL